MKEYQVVISDKALKILKKMDKRDSAMIMSFIKKNLQGTENPRIKGKALKGELGDFWRYRFGDYRILAEIDDGEIKIFVIDIGHRREIYR